MVSSLAGSLALVTCKDPLRVALANNMRALLAGSQVCMMCSCDGPRSSSLPLRVRACLHH